eukprot:TRINITY_DN1138_c0_g1_i4.p1 TRINITY_DN1138_c0_g1~~TRINITY_DN1138_c0_g1_i4.p1  ORF type:complete len:351 (+),score=87.59 TRINITY_DN1138_c0_g1_i4:96-1055(+)
MCIRDSINAEYGGWRQSDMESELTVSIPSAWWILDPPAGHDLSASSESISLELRDRCMYLSEAEDEPPMCPSLRAPDWGYVSDDDEWEVLRKDKPSAVSAFRKELCDLDQHLESAFHEHAMYAEQGISKINSLETQLSHSKRLVNVLQARANKCEKQLEAAETELYLAHQRDQVGELHTRMKQHAVRTMRLRQSGLDVEQMQRLLHAWLANANAHEAADRRARLDEKTKEASSVRGSARALSLSTLSHMLGDHKTALLSLYFQEWKAGQHSALVEDQEETIKRLELTLKGLIARGKEEEAEHKQQLDALKAQLTAAGVE